tara:strand:- start:38617 stop:39003 length:387 start_codon:yes stop_codon:yes gene_type:complete
MIKSEIGQKVKDVKGLPSITPERYENALRVYELEKGDRDTYLFYNITRRISIDTESIDPDALIYYRVQGRFPWTAVSYFIYKSQYLWWLLIELNDITDPTVQPAPGTVIRAIKPELVDAVLAEIQQQT